MPTVNEICIDKMKRSDEAFDDAVLLYNDQRYNGSANRLYYAVFHAVAALVFKKSGEYSKTHAGLKSLFNEQFIKSKKLETRFAKIYANIFELRQ